MVNVIDRRGNIKRFTDIQIWEKPWFRKLSAAEKCAFNFIKDRCDNVGVWCPDFEAGTFYIGEEVDWEGLIEKTNGNIEVLENGKWWLTEFCDFQHPDLKPESTSNVIQSYIRLLKKHGLWDRINEGYMKPSQSLHKGSKERERVRDKERVRVREEDKELHKSVRDAFQKGYGGNFDNYAKEGKAINALIVKARARSPDDPGMFIKEVMVTFWRLKKGREEFWKKQPFLPSTLNAGGLWPRVLEYLEENEGEPMDAALLKEVWG